jgi:PKHD-type hydroxylase
LLIPIENVLSDQNVIDIRTKLADGEWQDGRASAGGIAARVKANLQLNDNTELASELRQVVLAALQSHPLITSAALPKKIYPPKFNCYRNGGCYGLHVDGSIMNLPNGETLRTDISATLFLSDPEEYEGGELAIETQYGAQEVKLRAGDMVLYPSTSLHEVLPVTKGARTCAFFWFESLVRDNAKREILFDLDQSIQILTPKLSVDDLEVRRLSGIYHNLLRQWADT